MFQGKFLIGCVFIVSGIAWPTVSITRGLSQYSQVCHSAIEARRTIRPVQKQAVVAAVEQASSAIVGGILLGLFGIGLALVKHQALPDPPSETPETMDS